MREPDWTPWIDRLQRLIKGGLEPALRRFIDNLMRQPSVQQALATAGIGELWVREALGLVPNLVVLIAGLLGEPDIPQRTKFIFLASVGYVILPFDLIPDRIPGLGQLDDLLVVALGLHMLLNEPNQIVVTSHWHGNIESLRLIQIAIRALAERVPQPVLENARRWAS
ncbi:MAG: DUF1232 domain-containing protein [Ardenticatenaceae bacterium]|nr:DUF1232 domain-containing protein [Ardenticatenaceae bacterium]HBY98456.1 hypothetical protein [Chloroflexota bacterium]